MNKIVKNEKGFSAVEIVLVVVIVALIGVVGWLVYKNHHKTSTLNPSTTSSKAATKSTISSTSSTKTTINPYAGWKTFSLSSLGLSFQYPSTWTVTQGQPQCTGAIQVTAVPGSTELSQAASAIGASLNKFTLFVEKYGTESANCAPDGNNFKGDNYTYLQSSEILQSGVFKGDWLTFFGSTTGNKSQTLPDTGIVTDTDYTTSPGTFSDAGTLTYNNTTYQIEINTSSVVSQQYTQPVPMNITELSNTTLYKDTVNILNSFTAN